VTFVLCDFIFFWIRNAFKLQWHSYWKIFVDAVPRNLPTARSPAIDLILKRNIDMLFYKEMTNLQFMSFLARPGTCWTKTYIIYIKKNSFEDDSYFKRLCAEGIKLRSQC